MNAQDQSTDPKGAQSALMSATVSRRRLIAGGAVGAAMLAASTDARSHGSPVGNVANVRDPAYAGGAVGDGTNDDTAAIQAAFGSGKGVIYFPAGIYKVIGTAGSPVLTVANRSLVVMGDGAQATQILWDPGADRNGANDHLIQWSTTTTSASDRLEVREITLRTKWNVGTAIHATRAAAASELSQRALIENVAVAGSQNDGLKSFMRAVYLDSLEWSRIVNLSAESNWRSGTVGIEITSGSPGSGLKATVDYLHHVSIVNFETGILFGGYCEGLTLTDSNIIGCGTGLITGLSQEGLPGVWVRGCHFNCYGIGIGLHNCAQAFINDNLIYMDNGNGQYYIAIHVGQFASGIEKDVMIRGNTIFRIPPDANEFVVPNSWGVFIPGSAAKESVLVSDNVFVLMDIGVLSQAGTAGILVTDTNRYRACGTPFVNGGGAANLFQGSIAPPT